MARSKPVELSEVHGFSGRLRQHVRLAPFTTWNIGGYAECLAEPDSIDSLLAIVEFARSQGLPLTILGRGSNVLIDDHGIPGMVVCLRRCLQSIMHDPKLDLIRAEAGCPLPKLAVYAASRGIEGFEFMVGIPGTVGAGTAINAGIGGRSGPSMSQIVSEVDLLDLESALIETIPAEMLEMAYRHTRVIGSARWVVSATFKAERLTSASELKARHQRILRKRATEQPLNKRTSGSVFKAVEGGYAAGWYIDRAGLKGLCVGGARVSEKHANWIENTGYATAADVRELIETVQSRVHEVFGVHLHREVVYLPGDRAGSARGKGS